MNKILNILFCAFIIQAGLYSQEPVTIFKLGNSAYEKEDYNTAIINYESILKLGYHSEELYFNMGNAYYKSNQLGKAILFYERALRLSPGNKDVQYNLKLLNELTVDKIEIIPRIFFMQWWFNISGIYSSGHWSFIFIVVLFISCVSFGLFYYFIKPESKKTAFYLFVLSLGASILMLLLSQTQKNIEQNTKDAIILVENIYVKTAPAQSGDDKFILHEGTKVSILEAIDGWYEIRLSDGKRGWVSSKSLEVI